jgi:hypothetical protein
VFTGDLPPTSHAACSLDPFALWTALPPSPVARYCHDYYGSSATSRRQQRTVRLPRAHQPGLGGHRRDASHVHSYTGWQGRRPAVPRGHRRALPQHSTRPRPPDQQTSGQDGPHEQRGPSIPTAHSRQFRGCCPVSGLQPLVSVSLRLSALLANPARWRRTVPTSSRAACRPTPHLQRQCCPPASPDRCGGRGWGLAPHPVVWRLVAQCSVGRRGAADSPRERGRDGPSPSVELDGERGATPFASLR